MITSPPGPPISVWLQQIAHDPLIGEVIMAALREGRGVQVVLRMNSRGIVLSPKVTVGE